MQINFKFPIYLFIVIVPTKYCNNTLYLETDSWHLGLALLKQLLYRNFLIYCKFQ